MNIKSVVFDAYGTLFDVNSAAEKNNLILLIYVKLVYEKY